MIEVLTGISVGVLMIVLARYIRGERWLYSLSLITLPGAYALYALLVGEPTVSIKEIVFGLPYVLTGLACTFISIRKSAVLVGTLWLLHGPYDLIHSQLIRNTGVPGWYPLFCAAVDIVVGAYLLWLSRHLPRADLRQA